MRQTIFITGIAGSGKSAVSRILRERGYAAYDIEEIDGLFAMVKKGTGERFSEYSNDDIESVKQADWNCDPERLKQLIDEEENDLAFYCGTASNWRELLRLFDRVFVLVADPETIRQRLSVRASGEFGNTPEAQAWVLSWKDWWEDQMGQHGAVTIKADQPLDRVVDEILPEVV